MVLALRLAMIIIGIARFSYINSLMKSIMYLIYLLIQFLYEGLCFVRCMNLKILKMTSAVTVDLLSNKTVKVR